NHRSGGAPGNQARGVESDRLDYDQWQLFGKWTHNFAGGASARLSLDYFDRASDSDLRSVLGYERFASTTALSGNDEQVRHRVSVELRAPELDWLQFASLMVYRQDNRTGQRTGQYRRSRGVPVFLQRDFDLRETSWGGEAKLRHGFTFGTVEHTVVAGLEWDARELTEQRDALQTSLVDGSSTNTVLGETFPLRDLPRSRSDRLGVYLQDEIELGRLTLIPAVRWDRFTLDAATDGISSVPGRVTDLDSDDVSLRIGLTWRASDALSLYGHYAEGFRAPPAEDVNLLLDIPLFNIRAIPNPDLAPERLRNLEAGFRFARGGSALSFGAYYSKYDDFIESRTRIGTDPVTGALLFQSRNLAEATIAGLEAEASQHLGAWHPLLGSWLVTGGVHWAGGENDVTGAPLNEVSPLKAVLALQWQPEAGSLAAELRATHLGGKGGVDESGGAFFVAPSATVIDLTLRWQPTTRSQVHLGVYNLTDRRYWRYPDTRQLAPDDPRIEVLSRPGTNVALTIDIGF
ncbi:MAG: TonB-dependent receptor, partial [Gammaproteobacteria bacterium]|nr:TonB-dependent receptor [Gammaproteobacteria bacterium]